MSDHKHQMNVSFTLTQSTLFGGNWRNRDGRLSGAGKHYTSKFGRKV